MPRGAGASAALLWERRRQTGARPRQRSTSGISTPSCGAREPPVAAGGLAAVPRERAVEGVLGRVANLAGDRPDCVSGVLQSLRREVHAPAREVCQWWLAHDLREAPRERSAREVDLECERVDRPLLGRPLMQNG